MWHHEITENPEVGATEVWEFYNATEDAHPMHIHETTFEVVNRQPIVVSDEEDQPLLVQVMPGSAPTPPESWETGLKETVIAYPGQVTRSTHSSTLPASTCGTATSSNTKTTK